MARKNVRSNNRRGIAKPRRRGVGGRRVASNQIGPKTRKPGPGKKNYSLSRTTPATSGNSRAWYRTVVDPAHARGYGCVGVPDENQDPTLVLTTRFDGVISNNSLKNSVCYGWAPARFQVPSGSGSSSISYTQDMWLRSTCTGAETVNRVDLIQFPQGVFIQHWIGSFHCSATFSNTGADGKPCSISMAYDTSDILVVVAEGNAKTFSEDERQSPQSRVISSSITIENVTAWAQTGGYFNGGHFPQVEAKTNASDFVVSDDRSEILYQHAYFVPVNLDNYCTYTGGSAAGAYVVARPRNVHCLTHWETLASDFTTLVEPYHGTITNATVKIGVAGGSASYALVGAESVTHFAGLVGFTNKPFKAGDVISADMTDGVDTFSAITQTLVGWDASFASWFPTTDTWTLRLTRYYNIETKRSYELGGTDGARCDRLVLQMLMGALDYTGFIYPASKNDTATVRRTLLSIYSKYRGPIMDAMGVAGVPKFVIKCADKLLSGMAAKQSHSDTSPCCLASRGN